MKMRQRLKKELLSRRKRKHGIIMTEASTGRRGNMELEDKLAEELENRGQWHRAARRWLAVMDSTSSDQKREAIARRREHCISMASNVPPDGRRKEAKRRYKIQGRYNDGY